MNSRQLAPLVLVLVLVIGTVAYVSSHPPRPREDAPTPPPVNPAPLEPTPTPAPQEPNEDPVPALDKTSYDLRLFDDAKRKSGDFWIEQVLSLPVPEGRLCELYLTYDVKTGGGVRARLSHDQVVLERSTSGTDPWSKPEVLAQGPVSSKNLLNLRVVFGALWRRGELSLWLDGAELLSLKAPLDLTGTSAVRLAGPGARLRERRSAALGSVAFRDSFMRDQAGSWTPVQGRWELTGMVFPERSANPFALRAVFGRAAADTDQLFEGRVHPPTAGLGIQLSVLGGIPVVGRITGGSPAEHIGLQEDDAIMAIDGQELQGDLGVLMAQLHTADNPGRTVTLTVLRAGAKELLNYTVTSNRERRRRLGGLRRGSRG
jgi:hypothetical protein